MNNNLPFVNKTTVTESDIKALKVAHKQEQQKIKEGWRFHKINDRLQVLVPYGDDGKPTDVGLRMIEARKQQVL